MIYPIDNTQIEIIIDGNDIQLTIVNRSGGLPYNWIDFMYGFKDRYSGLSYIATKKLKYIMVGLIFHNMCKKQGFKNGGFSVR